MTLPHSLNTLRTFAVAAKHLSFKVAADELCLSASAVSRQIGNLEQQLGCSLFLRQPRGLVLTAEGSQLNSTLQLVFAQLQSTLQAITPRQQAQSQPLLISVQAYFANHWLLPRLPRFKQLYPQVQLQFESAKTYTTFEVDKMDGCFRFAPPLNEQLTNKKLFRQFAVPVAAPALLQQKGWDGDLEILSRLNWCHTQSQPALWRQWAEAWGLPHLQPLENVYFDDADTALQAAKNGIGVALAAWPLVAATVAGGDLVRLTECHPQLHADYYFVYASANTDPRLSFFIDWLDQEIATE